MDANLLTLQVMREQPTSSAAVLCLLVDDTGTHDVETAVRAQPQLPLCPGSRILTSAITTEQQAVYSKLQPNRKILRMGIYSWLSLTKLLGQ